MTKAEIAKHIFARNPKVDKLHITSDGQAFYEKHQAEGHSQRLKDKKIETVTRKGGKSEEPKTEAKDLKIKEPKEVGKFDFLEGNVSEVAEVVKTIETAEELNAIAEAENAGENRKGVQKAIDERIAELKS